MWETFEFFGEAFYYFVRQLYQFSDLSDAMRTDRRSERVSCSHGQHEGQSYLTKSLRSDKEINAKLFYIVRLIYYVYVDVGEGGGGGECSKQK